jgi:dihydroorotate dehydrogenase
MLLDAGAAALRLLPPEAAHGATVRLLRLAGPFLPAAPADDPRLAVKALGLSFPNPIGLSAGFDKDALAPDAALKLGFGFVECGTVTPLPQPGNPHPRLFRLYEDRAVINRMGFNNKGMEAFAARVAGRARNGILGINIGANKDSADRIADYARAFSRLAQYADYVTVNISSPNTPGLRGLQDHGQLQHLLEAVTDARGSGTTPVLLKVAPDIDQAAVECIAEIVLESGIEGIILTNTTLAREGLKSAAKKEAGGLSGAPLFARSTDVLRQMRKFVGGRLVLVGVGGVSSGADAYAKIRAGATLVQLYTALAFHGPGLVARIKRELLALLTRDGFANVGEAVGADLR